MNNDELAEKLPLALLKIAREFNHRATRSNAHHQSLMLGAERMFYHGKNPTKAKIIREIWETAKNLPIDLAIVVVTQLQKWGTQSKRIDSLRVKLDLRSAEITASEMLDVRSPKYCAQFLHRKLGNDYSQLVSNFAKKSGYPSIAEIIKVSPMVEIAQDPLKPCAMR